MKKIKKIVSLLIVITLLFTSNQLIAQTNSSPTQTVCVGSLAEPYLISPPTTGSTYQWTLSAGGTLNNGTTTDNITVDWGLSPGIYTITVIETDANGCLGAPVTVDVTVIPSTLSNSTFVGCDNYIWNGVTYTSSGVYTFATTNSNGCDSTATLNLTINPATTSSVTITECDTYSWNGVTYTTSGVYTFATVNSNGCDSTAILNLTINSFTTAPLASNQTACFGSTIPDLIATGVGATLTWYSDSLLTLVLVNNSAFSSGQTAVGSYVYYVTDSQNGCESPASTVTLIIYPTPTTGPIIHW